VESHSEGAPGGQAARLRRSFAAHGWVGLLLVAICWPANWLLSGLRTHVLFAPLWLGFALAVDAVVLRRTGTSMFTRSRKDFALLFLISVPVWWLFELLNVVTGNWIYVGREHFSDLAWFVFASVSFSTVIPAVFASTELMASLRPVSKASGGAILSDSAVLRVSLLAVGVASAVLVWASPTRFYPLIWGVVFFLLEPVNQWLDRPSIFRHLRTGDWRPVVSLALGTLFCGIFWELWNYHSFPKWTYVTPGVNFLHVFEMPLLGYLGYPPFGLELFVLAGLMLGREVISWHTPGLPRR